MISRAVEWIAAPAVTLVLLSFVLRHQLVKSLAMPNNSQLFAFLMFTL